MQKSIFAAVAVASMAAFASAEIPDLGLAGFGGDAPRMSPTESVLVVDISGVLSMDGIGSSNNVVLNVDIAALAGEAPGTHMQIDAIGWDVILQTIGASWASEAVINFNNEIFLTVGANDDFPLASPTNYNSGGLIDLSSIPLPSIDLPTGILTLEFFESYDDVAGSADAVFNQPSSLLLEASVVPEPATLGLLAGLSLLGLRRR